MDKKVRWTLQCNPVAKYVSVILQIDLTVLLSTPVPSRISLLFLHEILVVLKKARSIIMLEEMKKSLFNVSFKFSSHLDTRRNPTYLAEIAYVHFLC